MSLLHLLLVALIQGLTEFLPVSSSAHLILLPALTGLPDQGLTLDVAAHVGTLVAVCLYFREDVARLLAGLADWLRGRPATPEGRFTALLALATVPVVVAGALAEFSGLADALRSPRVIAWATIGFGLLLWVADRFGPSRRAADGWTTRDALVMGLAQVLALIPGTSRSGITTTAARALGYRRTDALRLAMVMSIPTILASGVLKGLEAAAGADLALLRDGAIVAALSALAALLALAVMMRLARRVSFTPYVLYRLALGAGLLWWLG